MKQKRLDRIEKKLGEELPRVGIIIRETDPEGKVTEHIWVLMFGPEDI